MSSVLLGAGLDSYRYQFGGKTEHALAEIIDNSIQWRKEGCEARVEVNVILDRERTISEEGLKLFNLSMNDLSYRKNQLKKNKGLLRSVMIDLFTTEYDINLIDTVDKLRMSSCYLYVMHKQSQ